MKVGFLGNANNYPFMLARAMKALGSEIVFIVDSPNALNRPESRYPEISLPYPKWIHDFSDLDLWSYPKPKGRLNEVVSLLSNCDVLVLNESGFIIGDKIKKPIFALLTGTDLEIFAEPRYADIASGGAHYKNFSIKNMVFLWRKIHQILIKMHFMSLIKMQRSAISSAELVSYFPPGTLKNGDRLLKEMGVSDSDRIYCMQSEVQRYGFADQPNNKIFTLFNVARIQWDKSGEDLICELDYKGTDVMIKGLGMYIRQNKLPIQLRLVKKGKDIEKTKKLILAEGLESSVVWLNPMDQNGIYQEYKNADIVLDHLGLGMFGMGTLDAMAVGRPVITNGQVDIISKFLGDPPPFCHATTPEEVCIQVETLLSSSELRNSIGKRSREYVEKYCDPGRYAKIVLEKFEVIGEK